jgi:uncharacterized membrane protein
VPRANEDAGTQGADLSAVVARNIHALLAARRRASAKRTAGQRLADGITRLAGTIGSAVLHAAFFAGWIGVNVGAIPGVAPFDPFPFVMLAMFASVEAILLTTFVLISQNRMADEADKRAELDLQINLLAEHEITRLVTLVDAIADHLGVAAGDDEHLEELKRDVQPERVLDVIAQAKQAEE